MLSASLALSSVGDFLRRLADLLKIDGAEVARSGAHVLGIWLLAFLAYRLVGLLAHRIEKTVDDGDEAVTTTRERRGQTIAQLLRSMGRVVIVAIAILLSFNVFIDIGPILAGAGILGLAVSFGAQSLVKDIISGFFILFENQFGIGDVIEVAGKSGTVEKMTLRVVVLRDVYGVMHVVPNGEIKVVSNKTRGWSRAVVDVSVSRTVDIDHAIEVIRYRGRPVPQRSQVEARAGWPRGSAGHRVGHRYLGDDPIASSHAAGLAVERRARVSAENHRAPAPGGDRRAEGPAEGAGTGGRRAGVHGRHPATGRRRADRMTLRLYNTLTRQVEPFHPLQPGRVSFYTCGPTVYNYAHIGNFRTFLFEDLLRRWLEASGYEVFHIMNLTDVDDKTIGGAVKAGQPLREYVQPLHRGLS